MQRKHSEGSLAIAKGTGHWLTSSVCRHFGRPLEESLRVSNEAMELHLIDKAIAYIRSKSLKTQGIFRLPGNATSIERLRARIDGGDDVNFEIEDEHDVSSLLKVGIMV